MRDTSTLADTDLDRLMALVERLRGTDGCPWDREQTLGDLRAYLLEEAHEAADAIDREDFDGLCSELGDLLFQVAFLTRLAEEASEFRARDPIARVTAKMIERHPHVFGDEEAADSRAVRDSWERRKLKHEDHGRDSLLDGAAAKTLPALVAAYRLTQKAAGVGFDWPDVESVLDKVVEETEELRVEIRAADGVAAGGLEPHDSAKSTQSREGRRRGRDRMRQEVGDLLFAVANLARHLELDPEAALAAANLKFRRRFAVVEAGLSAAGQQLGEASLAEMEALWNEAKSREATGPGPSGITAETD